MTRTRRPRQACQNAVAWAVIVRELLTGHCTALELAEVTGLRHETVLGYLRALKRQNAIYVAARVEDSNGRKSTASYALGDKPDAPRTPMSRNVIKQRYRAKAPQREVFSILGGQQ